MKTVPFSAIFYVTLSCFCVALLNALGKILITTIPTQEILFFQNAFALFPILVISSWKRVLPWPTERFKLHALRAITGVLFYACFFISVKYISLLNATLLTNATPLFLPFVVWVWLHHKISFSLWASLIIGFIGVIFIIHPTKEIYRSWMVLIALSGALFSAIALQCIRNLRTTEASLTITFYYFFLASLITFPFLVFQWHTPNITEWLQLFSIGILLFFAQYLLALAYNRASPVQLGPFNYSIIIFAGLIGWIYLNEIPYTWDLVGVLLVCSGGLISTLTKAR